LLVPEALEFYLGLNEDFDMFDMGGEGPESGDDDDEDDDEDDTTAKKGKKKSGGAGGEDAKQECKQQ